MWDRKLQTANDINVKSVSRVQMKEHLQDGTPHLQHSFTCENFLSVTSWNMHKNDKITYSTMVYSSCNFVQTATNACMNTHVSTKLRPSVADFNCKYVTYSSSAISCGGRGGNTTRYVHVRWIAGVIFYWFWFRLIKILSGVFLFWATYSVRKAQETKFMTDRSNAVFCVMLIS